MQTRIVCRVSSTDFPLRAKLRIFFNPSRRNQQFFFQFFTDRMSCNEINRIIDCLFCVGVCQTEKKKRQKMFELNVYNLVLMPLLVLVPLLVAYAVCSRLMLPLEYRQISSHVPSITKSFWTEMLVSWDLATKHPKGTNKL